MVDWLQLNGVISLVHHMVMLHVCPVHLADMRQAVVRTKEQLVWAAQRQIHAAELVAAAGEVDPE